MLIDILRELAQKFDFRNKIIEQNIRRLDNK